MEDGIYGVSFFLDDDRSDVARPFLFFDEMRVWDFGTLGRTATRARARAQANQSSEMIDQFSTLSHRSSIHPIPGFRADHPPDERATATTNQPGRPSWWNRFVPMQSEEWRVWRFSVAGVTRIGRGLVCRSGLDSIFPPQINSVFSHRAVNGSWIRFEEASEVARSVVGRSDVERVKVAMRREPLCSICFPPLPPRPRR